MKMACLIRTLLKIVTQLLSSENENTDVSMILRLLKTLTLKSQPPIFLECSIYLIKNRQSCLFPTFCHWEMFITVFCNLAFLPFHIMPLYGKISYSLFLGLYLRLITKEDTGTNINQRPVQLRRTRLKLNVDLVVIL